MLNTVAVEKEGRIPELTSVGLPEQRREIGRERGIELDNERFGKGYEPALRAVAFPEISFEEFKTLPYSMQRNIIARNRIVNTDTYNRTMNELSGKLFDAAELERTPETNTANKLERDQATFTLQMRRSPFNYLVACGVEDLVEELTFLPISKAELDFAKAYYKEAKVPFFDEKMWTTIVEDHKGKLPFEIHGVRDGTIVLPGEPLLLVKGPEEVAAHFEHLFHRLFYPTLVATRAHALLQIIEDPSRFVEVGKRGSITEDQHLQALKAAYVGGGFTLTSNDAGIGLLPYRDTGTIGHRYVQRFPSEEAAFRHAIENLPAVTLLVDLVDTNRGIDLSLRLKEEYRDTGKKIWVRLDSGDIKEQVRYFLRETMKRGMTDPVLDRVVVEGLDGLPEIADIEKMIIEEFGQEARKRVIYGAGGLLVSDQTSRSDASTGYKLAKYTDASGTEESTMKFSNSPGKISYPGDATVVISNGRRFIAQMGESLPGDTMGLFEPLYLNGANLCFGSSPEEARLRLARHEALLDLKSLNAGELKALRGQPSPATKALIDELYGKYGLPALN